MGSMLRWLRFAWLNTLRNRRRSLVTVTIVALGTAGILLSAGFALYTYEALAEDAARRAGHLTVAKAEFFETEEDMPLQHGLDRVAELRRRLLAHEEVRQVLPRIEFTGLASNGDKSIVALGAGIDPDAEFAIKGPFLTITAGKVLQTGQKQKVLLGAGLAKTLKLTAGGGLTLLVTTAGGALNGIDVQVAGVFTTGVAELDKRLVYTDLDTAQQLLGSARISSMGVFLSDMGRTDAMQRTLAQELKPLAVKTWQQQAEYYNAVRALYDRIFGALGLVIATIVLFVIGNAMAMTVIERSREVGTLRAIGTLPEQLTRNFALEGLILGGAGAVVGGLVALSVSIALLLVDIQMPPPPGRSDTYPLNISMDPWLYGITLVGMVLLSSIVAAFVARRSVRQPITGLLAMT